MQCTQTLELLIKALDILLLSVIHLKPEIFAQHPVLIAEPHLTSKKSVSCFVRSLNLVFDSGYKASVNTVLCKSLKPTFNA